MNKRFKDSRISRSGLVAFSVAASLAIFTPALAKEEKTPVPATKSFVQIAQGMKLLNYKPPGGMGAPNSRVGGGTRAGVEAVKIDVLAPDHLGHTSQASPTLYWHTDAKAGTATIVVIGMDAMDPAMEIEVPIKDGGGIQAVSLSARGISLEANMDYEWSVSVVPDPKQRSHDTMAGGAIRFVPPSGSTADRIASSQGRDKTVALAEGGYWYDAMGEAHSAYAAGGSADARDLAVELLRIVKLEQIASAYR